MLAVRAHERRLGIALHPWQAQPSLSGTQTIQIATHRSLVHHVYCLSGFVLDYMLTNSGASRLVLATERFAPLPWQLIQANVYDHELHCLNI